MSKYNLTDLYEGMSDKEFSDAQEKERLEKHPEKDKIKAIQAMMAKEKEKVKEVTSREGSRIESLLDQNIKAKFLNVFEDLYFDLVEEDPFHAEDVVEHLGIEMLKHLDSIQNEGDKLASISSKYDEFDVDPRDIETMSEEESTEEIDESDKPRPGYHADGTPKSNDEMDDDEREEFYSDLDSVDEDQTLKEHFGRFLKDYQ